MRAVCRSLLMVAVLLIAGTQQALSQRCPPNSHPEFVAFAGNLRTAQCFCDPGYVRVQGICMRAARPAERALPSDPARALVVPMR